MKLWIGKEKEGELKGMWTLFVGHKDVATWQIGHALKHNPRIKQIYFGAGVCSPVNNKTVEWAIDATEHIIITVEVDYKKLRKLSEKILKWARLVVSITDLGIKKLKVIEPWKVQIKLQSLKRENNFVLIGGLDSFKEVDTRKLEGKTYKGDKVLR